MKQERLPLPRDMQKVDIEHVRRMPSMTRAISLCVELGGFENDKDFCREYDIDPTVWARIQAGERNFPHDGFPRLFECCGNEVPLIWLADQRGYVLTPKETEMERRLRIAQEKLAESERTNAVLMKALQGRAAA